MSGRGVKMKGNLFQMIRERQWLCGVIAGVAFLAIGVVTGQLTVIWKKAVMICLECIGIG